MKKLLLLSVCAVFLLNCTDTTTTKGEKTEKDSTEKKDVVKKPGDKKPEDKKPEAEKIFEDVKTEDLTKADNKGWPEARQSEVRKMCMDDADDMPEKAATAYCNCQLNNLMKIFESYKEAVDMFNKTEDQLTADERKKAQMVMDTEQSCWDQNMDEEGDMEKEGDESRPKKGNN